MEQHYSVTLCGKAVGKVQVQRKGLFYQFRCHCCLSGKTMYRLLVTCGAIQESLGILVPQDNSFVLNTNLPVKRIGEGEMSFLLVPRHEVHTGTFVPICPEEPFTYISRLKESFLVFRDGQHGVLIKQKQEP